jgi:hypothetical protein
VIRSFGIPGDSNIHQVVFLNSKKIKMKRTLIVLALICITAIGVSSCTAQQGCHSTRGYVGYGSR